MSTRCSLCRKNRLRINSTTTKKDNAVWPAQTQRLIGFTNESPTDSRLPTMPIIHVKWSPILFFIFVFILLLWSGPRSNRAWRFQRSSCRVLFDNGRKRKKTKMAKVSTTQKKKKWKSENSNKSFSIFSDYLAVEVKVAFSLAQSFWSTLKWINLPLPKW